MAQVSRTLAQTLRSLTPIRRADSVYEVANKDRINAIQDAIHLISRGDHIVPGSNLRKHTGDGYVMLSGKAGGGVRPTSEFQHFPFEISIEQNPDTDLPTVRVRAGTLNNMMPTNMFDNFDISETGTWYIVLDVITDGDTPTDVSINQVTTAPDVIPSSEEVAPETFSILLGVIVDQEIFQIIYNIINIVPQLTILSLNDTPIPGQPFYTLNYTWQINVAP